MPFAIGERYAGFAASGDEFPVSQADRVRQIARARDDFAASPAAIGGGFASLHLENAACAQAALPRARTWRKV
jgi:hypothetical protein